MHTGTYHSWAFHSYRDYRRGAHSICCLTMSGSLHLLLTLELWTSCVAYLSAAHSIFWFHWSYSLLAYQLLTPFVVYIGAIHFISCLLIRYSHSIFFIHWTYSLHVLFTYQLLTPFIVYIEPIHFISCLLIRCSLHLLFTLNLFTSFTA